MIAPLLLFQDEINSLYVAYFDGAQGYQLVFERLCRGQEVAAIQFNLSIEELDGRHIIYGHGDPNDKDAVALASTTQGEAKLRNRRNGHNSAYLARMLIVSVYQLWEDHYREQVASTLGVRKNEVKSDLFGDLRRFRQAIVHNGGIAIEAVKNNVCIPWFNPGDAISPTTDQMKQLLFMLRNEMERLGRPGS